MVIVEAGINASIPHLLFKVLGTAESVNVGWVKYCAADSEIHMRSPEIAFQDFRDRARKTTVSGGVFRVIRGDAKGHPRRVGNRGGIPVYTAVLNSRHWAPETEVVLCVPAADEGVCDG